MKNKAIVGLALCMGIITANAQSKSADPKDLKSKYENSSSLNKSDNSNDNESGAMNSENDSDNMKGENSTTSSDNNNVQDNSSKTNSDVSYETTRNINTVSYKDRGESVVGTLWRAPFRIVGYTAADIGEGFGHIGRGVYKGGLREVGEGLAHIVASPFRGVGKAFKSRKQTETVTTVEQSTAAVPNNVDAM